MDSFYQYNQNGDSQRLNQSNSQQQGGNQSRIPSQFNAPVSAAHQGLQNNSNGVTYGSGYSQQQQHHQQQQAQHVQRQQIHASSGGNSYSGTHQFQQQQAAQARAPAANMYNYNGTAPPPMMQSQNNHVPNPLGMGSSAPSTHTADQTAMLKSFYQSRQQQALQQQGQVSTQSNVNQQQQMHSPQIQPQQQQQSQRPSMSPMHTSHQQSQQNQYQNSNPQYQNQNYGYSLQNQQYNPRPQQLQQTSNFQVSGQVHGQIHHHHQQGQLQQQTQMMQQQQVQQHAAQQVQQQRQQSYPSQQAQAHQSFPQQQQQQQSSSRSSSQKQKFNLTPQAKAALREAVLSSIHNNGEMDPVLLQRAIDQGLPRQAILNAANVARERDKRNRQEREKQRQYAQQQQSIVYPNSQSQFQSQQSQQQQRQAQYQRIADMQLENKRQLEKAAAETALRDRQVEDARKKREMALTQQREAQQRQMEEERKRKETEALRVAASAEAKRNAALMGNIKPWGRSSYALVVGQGSKGAEVKSHSSVAPKMVHPNSSWGGASRCEDTTPALVAAYERILPEQTKIEGKLAAYPAEKVKSVTEQLREKLLKVNPELIAVASARSDASPASSLPPATPTQLRKRRIATISSKLINTHTMKRIKLQPKREGRFLDKHIKRARTMTADGIAKRHKDLLKAITTHQTEFYKFHKSKKTDAARLARTIRDQLKKAELLKEKEADQTERARIAALKSNDMAAYTALLEDTKNDRLKFLLDKTDEAMNQISTLLAARAEEEQTDSMKSGREMDPSFSEMVPVSGNYYETAHVKSEQVRQPTILTGGDLKEYQLSGLQWLVSLYNNRLNGILADEMGLGKTIQTISLIAYLMEMKENPGPYLVIVPLSTLSNWVNEFAKWLPAASVICYKGTPNQRREIFRNEVMGHFNVLLTTYEFVIRDKSSLRKLEWQYAIVDEGHRMKNNQSKFAVTLGTQYTTKRRVLLTGTPLQNSLPELWALLNFLLPAVFSSAETFDQWFNKPFSSFGKTGGTENADTSEELLSNEERMLIIHRLHELLRPFMLRRVKSEVLDQLPDKVEKVLRCELSSWQKELYKQISTKIIGEAQGKNFNRGLNNVVMQLRKVCNHPFLFSKEGYHINDDIIRSSGKFELLDRILPKLKAAGHRVLMFTQMVKMMPILEDYFAYRGYRSIRLDGSTTADEREKRMYMYNSPDSPYFIFLLSTRAGGLGLNLATADTVIIFDSDWNPMMDLQAQDRAHRIGQRNDVRVFRLITQSPVEEKILGRAAEKLRMNELVVEAGKFDKSGQDEEEGSSLERLKMMELLLTDFDGSQYNQSSSGVNSEDDDKETDDGQDDDGDGNDVLNEMISSNDVDLALYSKMDLNGTVVPALYSDVESVPDWIRYPNGKPEEGSEPSSALVELPHKRKAAQGIVYDDGMTEKQFCRMMDKQSVAEEKAKKGRKKKRSRNAVDTSNIIDDSNFSRKRAKVTPLDQDTSTTRKKPAAVSENAPVTPEVNERLVSICRSLIYFKEKGTGRKMSEIFLEKPCPTTYPDYYQLINKPIGMNDILRKCRANLYSTMKEFKDDWNTLFTNASTYNGEVSWVALDANTLKAEFTRLIDKNTTQDAPTKRVESTTKPASAKKTKKTLRIKLSLKKAPSKTDTNTDQMSSTDGASDSEY